MVTSPVHEHPVAVSFAGPRSVQLTAEPERPLGSGEVRVRTLYSGISAGTELTAYRGSNVYLRKQWDPQLRLFQDGEASVSYPVVGLGYSEVGEVSEVSDSDDALGPLRRGDVVYGTWGHRGQVVVPAAALSGHRLPAGLDPLAGVFVRVGGIALNAVLAADIHLTETVVVTGQGVIGLLATRLAVLSGARVIAVDRYRVRREVALGLGAAETVDPGTGDVALSVRALVPEGADVVVELSGAYPALRDAIRCVRAGGRVVAAGFYQGPTTGLDLGEEFHHNRVTVVSSQIGGVAAGLADHWDIERLYAAVLGLLADGRLEVAPLVSHVVPVADAAAAYQLLDQAPGDALQVVLDFRAGPQDGRR